jgi:predicted transcriptional regulator
MYSLPQEIEVWYIIPAIRKELAKVLVERHGLTMEQAATILGVSKAAVSQYISRKRADKFKLPAKIKREIEKSADLMVQDKNVAVREILRLLNIIKKSKCSCHICKRYNRGILSLCQMKPYSAGEM